MEILQTAISAFVVASVGFVLARLANQRFEALESALVRVERRLDARIDGLEATFETRSEGLDRIDGLEAKFDANINALDAKFGTRFEGLDEKFDARFDALDRKFDAKVDSPRADLTQIALAVGARRATGIA